MKLSKNIEIQYSRNPLCNHNFQKKRDYNTMKLRVKLQWKKRDYYSKIDMDAKKQKKTVSKHENLWHFFKIGNTFLKSHFFFANEKKKLIFGTKKTKIMQQFQLKFFKNTLVRSVFYISNETLHFFKISFTETVWN